MPSCRVSQAMASPKDVLPAVNSALYDNIRRRLKQDAHITLTLIRFDKSGTLTFAGAHEDIMIYRAASDRIERIQTPGVWTAAIEDVRGLMQEGSSILNEGDIILLYTDFDCRKHGHAHRRGALSEPLERARSAAER